MVSFKIYIAEYRSVCTFLFLFYELTFSDFLSLSIGVLKIHLRWKDKSRHIRFKKENI